MTKFNPGIEVARFLAATLVIISHVYERWGGEYAFIKYYGHIGVDIFFIISGYVIGLGVFTEKKVDPFDFAIRRITRLAPSYWLLTIVAAIIILFIPEIARYRSSLEFEWLMSSLFFFPNETTYGVDKPLLGVGWTLNYEFLFYATVFFVLSLLGKKMIAALIVVTFYILCCSFFGFSDFVELFNPLLIYFILGITWSQLEKKIPSKDRKKIFLIFIPIFIFAFYFSVYYLIPSDYFGRVYFWGACAFTFVVLMTLLQDCLKVSKVISKLGAYSYAAYLLQVFLIPICYFSLNYIGIKNIFVAILSTTIVIWLSSAIYFKVIEKPLTRACYNALKL